MRLLQLRVRAFASGSSNVRVLGWSSLGIWGVTQKQHNLKDIRDLAA